MKSVRIQPINGTTVLIDIVCDCGQNGMRNKQGGYSSFKHAATLGATDFSVELDCVGCGKEYVVRPQKDHVHVSEVEPKDKKADQSEYTYAGD